MSKVIWFKTYLDTQVHRETDTHTDTHNPFFRDYLGGPVTEENVFWTLSCKGR